ncbi:hypothetical protein GF420_14360 [candidate division GN15 bacterium]|nr:hypothetical protein [candidate division GN15 bacterium]
MNLLYSLLAPVLVFGLSVASQQPGHDASGAGSERAETAESALKLAWRVTGFGGCVDSTVRAASAGEVVRRGRLEADVTPFVYEEIRKADVWIVRLDGVSICRQGDSCTDDRSRKSFEVYIEVGSGRFIGAQTVSPDVEDDLSPEPSAESATAELRTSRERYLGIPDSLPPTTVLSGLQSALGCNTAAAKELIVSYVVVENSFKEPFPAWVITSRGMPPLQIDPSISGIRRARCVVNALTGEGQYMTNSPHIGVE